ncbi:MAG: DUF1295 domain-containing protein, partial [Candidatus Schekmanbacteria bacterium]
MPLLLFFVLPFVLPNTEYFEKHFGEVSEHIWEFFCFAISFSGLIVRCIVCGFVPKKTSGRNTKKQEAKNLNTKGMYSIVRHPLYFANFLIFFGIILSTEVIWFIIVSVMAFWLYYERIMYAEEEFLQNKFGKLFESWSKTTPAFIPNISLWIKPDRIFSFKTCLRREYATLLLIVASFSILDILEDYIVEKVFEFDTIWKILLLTSFLIFICIGILKKKTKILKSSF